VSLHDALPIYPVRRCYQPDTRGRGFGGRYHRRRPAGRRNARHRWVGGAAGRPIYPRLGPGRVSGGTNNPAPRPARGLGTRIRRRRSWRRRRDSGGGDGQRRDVVRIVFRVRLGHGDEPADALRRNRPGASGATRHRGKRRTVSTTFGAVAGPNLVEPLGDLADIIGIPPLAGPFLLAA